MSLFHLLNIKDVLKGVQLSVPISFYCIEKTPWKSTVWFKTSLLCSVNVGRIVKFLGELDILYSQKHLVIFFLRSSIIEHLGIELKLQSVTFLVKNYPK